MILALTFQAFSLECCRVLCWSCGVDDFRIVQEGLGVWELYRQEAEIFPLKSRFPKRIKVFLSLKYLKHMWF